MVVDRRRVLGHLTVGDGIAAAVATGWIVLLGRILSHRIFVSHDTIISYAHVWYISTRIWSAHRAPWRMPVLGYGHGYAFPYGVVPWLTGGLLRPVFGDWTVTALLVTGVAAAILATFAAFPELRRGWWAAAVLCNPSLLAAALIGQIPFIWASALLLTGIACWRRGRWGWATLLVATAQLTHVAVIGPITAIVVAVGWWTAPRDRRRLLRCYAVTVVTALPAAWIVATSPVFSDAALAVKAANFIGTVAPRSLVVLVPIGLVAMQRRSWGGWAAALSAIALAGLVWGMWTPSGMPWAWRALGRSPDTRMNDFITSPQFRSDATYRVLRVADGKIGMYQLIRAGGRLDAEFFPESIVRRSWPDATSYAAFLRKRHVDDVMIWNGYTSKYKVNEQALLERTAAAPGGCMSDLCVRVLSRSRYFVVYRVERPPASERTA